MIKKGDFIRIEYTGRLETGEVFDSTDEKVAKKENIFNPNIVYKPIPVVIGAGFVVPGLEKEIEKMKVGEKKSVIVAPEEGFGKRDPKLVRIVPTKIFKEKDIDPKPGMIADFSGMKGRVQSVDAGRVRIDFNNPLAGKILKYELEIKELIEDEKERVNSLLEFFGITNQKVDIKEKIIDIEVMPLPIDLKNRISYLIIEFMHMEKIRFIEVFEKRKKEAVKKEE